MNVVLWSLRNQYTTGYDRIRGCELHFTPNIEPLKRTRSFRDVTTVTHIFVVNHNIERGGKTHIVTTTSYKSQHHISYTLCANLISGDGRVSEWLFSHSRGLIAPLADRRNDEPRRSVQLSVAASLVKGASALLIKSR